jgi:hypothetical protein
MNWFKKSVEKALDNNSLERTPRAARFAGYETRSGCVRIKRMVSGAAQLKAVFLLFCALNKEEIRGIRSRIPLIDMKTS